MLFTTEAAEQQRVEPTFSNVDRNGREAALGEVCDYERFANLRTVFREVVEAVRRVSEGDLDEGIFCLPFKFEVQIRRGQGGSFFNVEFYGGSELDSVLSNVNQMSIEFIQNGTEERGYISYKGIIHLGDLKIEVEGVPALFADAAAVALSTPSDCYEAAGQGKTVAIVQSFVDADPRVEEITIQNGMVMYELNYSDGVYSLQGIDFNQEDYVRMLSEVDYVWMRHYVYRVGEKLLKRDEAAGYHRMMFKF